MTKPGDSLTKKSIHELAKEFPEKTYRELEKYRDTDRIEEAVGISHNHPPEKMTIFDEERKKFKKACTLEEMRKDRTYPDLAEVLAIENKKLKKRAQEAEGELTIIKGIGNTSPEMKSLKSEVEALKQQLYTDRENYQKELDRIKRENNDLYNKIADLTEVAKSKDYFRDPDYKFLIEENRRLEEEKNELLVDNKKLAAEIEDRVARARKSGM